MNSKLYLAAAVAIALFSLGLAGAALAANQGPAGSASGRTGISGDAYWEAYYAYDGFAPETGAAVSAAINFPTPGEGLYAWDGWLNQKAYGALVCQQTTAAGAGNDFYAYDGWRGQTVAPTLACNF